MVATFAGGFTYGNVITLQINLTACTAENFDHISTLLSIAFIIFTISLFVTIFIQIILRGYDLNTTMPGGCNVAHSWVQILFFISAALLTAGFILLDIVLMHSGQKVVGAVGIALIAAVGTFAGVVGCFT